MLWFMSLLTFYSLFRFLSAGERRWLVYWSAASILSIYTSYIAFIFLITQNMIYLLISRAQIKRWLFANLVIGCSFIPWFLFAFADLIHPKGIAWIGEADYFEFFSRLFRLISGAGVPESTVSNFEMGFIAVLVVFALTKTTITLCLHQEDARSRWFLLAWSILPLAQFVAVDLWLTNIMVDRYMGFLHLPLILWLVVGLTEIPKRLEFTTVPLIATLVIFFPRVPCPTNAPTGTENRDAALGRAERRPNAGGR